VKVFSIISNLAGGGGRVLVDLVKAFSSHENMVYYGHPIGSLVFGLDKELDARGVPHRHVPCQDGLDKEIAAQRPDIVLYHWWPGATYRKEKGTTRWVMIIHSLMPAPRGYDYYIAVSRSCYQIQSHLPLGKKEVIYNGIDLEKFGQIHPVPHESFTIGRVSHLYPSKIKESFVDFLAGMEIPGWKAVIVGGGPMAEVLAQRAEVMKLRDQFEFPGALDHRSMLEYLRRFDLSLFFTDRPENHSMALLECMAMGVPVITEPKGGIPEIITHDFNGFMSFYEKDWKRYCHLIYRVPGLRERLSEGAKETSKRFDLRIQRKAYEELLQRFASGAIR
jgi:glycosyltransferase involved in cell wall biosynthesis